MVKFVNFFVFFLFISFYAGELRAGIQNKFFFEMQSQYDEFNEKLFRKIKMNYYLRGSAGKNKFDLNASYFEGDVKEEFSDVSRFNISKNMIIGLNYKRDISSREPISSGMLTAEFSGQHTIGSITNNTPGYEQPEGKLKLNIGVTDNLYITLFSGYTYKYIMQGGDAKAGEYSKSDGGVNLWYYMGKGMNLDFTYDIFYRDKPFKNMFELDEDGYPARIEKSERELTHYQLLNLSGNLWDSLNYYFGAQHAYADLTANYVFESNYDYINNFQELYNVIDEYYNLHWYAFEFYTLYSFGRDLQLMLWSMLSMERYINRPAYNEDLRETGARRSLQDIMGSLRLTYNLTGFTSIFFEYTYSRRNDNDSSVPWNEYTDNTYTAGLRIFN